MSWPTVRLGDVCDEIRDRIAVANVDLEKYVTTDNMLKGCAGVRIAESLPPAGSLVCFQEGDVLTSNIRPYLKKSWLANFCGGCSNDVIVYRPKDSGLSSKYLYAVLSSDAFFDYSMKNVSGAKMPRGKRNWIEQYVFPLPPLDEQKRIVEKLEKELKRVDEMKAKFERMEAAAEQYFKSALAEAFENVEGERVKLGEVCEIKNGYTPPASVLREEEGIPYYRVGAMNFAGNEKYLVTPNAYCYDLSKRVFKAGSVVFPKNGGAAQTHKVRILSEDSIVDLNTGLLIPKRDIEAEYLYQWLMSFDINKCIIVGTLPFVDFPLLSQAEFVLPSIIEQKNLVERISSLKVRVDRTVGAARRGIEACAKMRKALLAEAFA